MNTRKKPTEPRHQLPPPPLLLARRKEALRLKCRLKGMLADVKNCGRTRFMTLSQYDCRYPQLNSTHSHVFFSPVQPTSAVDTAQRLLMMNVSERSPDAIGHETEEEHHRKMLSDVVSTHASGMQCDPHTQTRRINTEGEAMARPNSPSR